MRHIAIANYSDRQAFAWMIFALVGLAWGSTQILSKLSTSTGLPSLGITFWSCVIGIPIYAALLRLKGERLALSRRALVFYGVCGLIGTALPNTLTYAAIRHIPVGVHSIMLSSVPVMTLLLAVALRVDRAGPRRVLGLICGFSAIVLIALPETSLPDPAQAIWVLVSALIAFSYASENAYIAKYRPPECGPLHIMLGLTIAALIMVTPAMLATGGWFPLWKLGLAERAVIGSSVLHVGAYLGLVWLISRSGPVFASQVGYAVTGTGIVLGMVILGERYSGWVWAGLVLMVVGVSLVQPRRRAATSALPAPDPAP